MTDIIRADGRSVDQLRPITIERGWSSHAEGSALISFGGTKVLCTASFTNGVPRWLTGKGKGWVTAEYAMLPRATNSRNDRESVKGRIGGRTHEISRLIGRALRAVVDTKALGENTIVIDCDVLQADGGTRTAAITGAYVALADAIEWGRTKKFIGQKATPLIDSVAAVSVGIIDGEPMLDLAYVEDVRAETDMNLVVTGRGLFVEVQGTAEGAPFDKRELDALLDLGVAGCVDLRELQLAALAEESVTVARVSDVHNAAAAGSEPRTVVLATHNQHKVEEFRAIVAATRPDLEVVGYDGPEPVEDGVTFAENALIKARAASAHTGLPALADDSGICVDVLGGAPGVFSAYWAGHAKDAGANLTLLLDQLSDVGDPHRGAQFVSTIALVVPGGTSPAEHVVEGRWPGRLATSASGAGGFGYDPIFIPDGQPAGAERTVGEWDADEKNAASHRARAFRELAPLLATI